MRKSDKTPMVDEPKPSEPKANKYARFEETYTTFDGTEFTTTPDMGAIEGTSYVINREAAPIFTMGIPPNERTFKRGKRRAVGSIKFTKDPPKAIFDMKISLTSPEGGTYSKTLYGCELIRKDGDMHHFSAREIGPMK